MNVTAEQLNRSSWRVLAPSAEVLAVHAALLRTGQVLYFSGDETDRVLHDLGQYDHTRLFDPVTEQVIPCGSPTTDVFCCGHATLGDGRLLVAGGIHEGNVADFFTVGAGIHTHHAPGSRATWLFDPWTAAWTRTAEMNSGPTVASGDVAKTGGRWYPSLLTLATGEVLALSGHPAEDDSRHHNNTPEVFPSSPDARSRWYRMPAAGDEDLDPAHTYPRIHALPDGSVFSATPFGPGGTSHRYDPQTGILSDLDLVPADAGDPPNPRPDQEIYKGYHFSSVLLPLTPTNGYRPRVLITNGKQPHVIDLGERQPQWRPTAPRTLAGSPSRWNATAVLLPTGHVLVVGGVELTQGPDGPQVSDVDAILAPELFDPETGIWATMPPASVPRNYHSTAVVLPDGRVFTGGSNANAFLGAQFVEKRIEILSPWYCAANVQRPVVTAAPGVLSPGAALSISVGDSATLARVVLLRTGSVTHCYNSDQRLIELAFQVSGPHQLLVHVPRDSRVAPPGDYLLFVIDSAGTPSEGRFLGLPAPAHWSRFARLSEAGKAASGTPVAAVSTVPGGVSLFVVDLDGAIQTSYFDPRV
jgi:hypothetical protein